MADAAWKKLNEKIRAKRIKTTKKALPKNHRRGDELTIQRLSAEVAGKAQKYTRIGPREFVPFDEHNIINLISGNQQVIFLSYFLVHASITQ